VSALRLGGAFVLRAAVSRMELRLGGRGRIEFVFRPGRVCRDLR
jgi:hypothetical protein